MPRKKSDPQSPISKKPAKGMKPQAEPLPRGDSEAGCSSAAPTSTAGASYSITLTQEQRESLIQFTRVEKNIKDRLEQAGEGDQAIAVNRKELERLVGKLVVAAAIAPVPQRKGLEAALEMAMDLMNSKRGGRSRKATPEIRTTAETKAAIVYQFKITLLKSAPPIWRRIQVTNCTLDTLHEHIQTAMGWTNSHLHQFEIEDEQYGDPHLLDGGFSDFEGIDSTKTRLSDVLPKKTKKPFAFYYEYDFGDDWEHEVLFEGEIPVDPAVKYPICIAGERACPPEDCGGVWGYAELLDAIRNPKLKEHKELLEWIGGRFDPDKFNAKSATQAMRKGLPDWRNMG